MTENLRRYGKAPFQVAVIHGGPGAAGEMAPVASELAASRGVLEPLQTSLTVDGQVEELDAALEAEASLPAALVGHSWGAWLGLLVAARHPELVARLILVASGPFEARYAANIHATRMARLGSGEQQEYQQCVESLAQLAGEGRNRALARLGVLASRADAYELLPGSASAIDFRADIYRRVWPQASVLRASGQLLQEAARVRCPVVAIHGDHDPHPAEGVEVPLSAVLDGFSMHRLARCGHSPWLERWARDEFFQLLEQELDAA